MGKPEVRPAVVVVAVILTAAAGQARLPEAPRPHPPLGEWVAEYRRLGLPVPPPVAELVRIELPWAVGPLPEHRKTPPYRLGFRLPAARRGDPPRFLIGRGNQDQPIDPLWARPVRPDAEALREVEMMETDLLCLAAQCELRGWDEFARLLYDRAQAERRQIDQEPGEIRPWDETLHEAVWGIVTGPLTQRASDRSEVHRQMRLLIAEYPDLRTPENLELLGRVERTVAPRKSKPGSVEALIDELTDHWHEPFVWPASDEGHTAYLELAELGPDAVPALLEHLDDDRLTRAYSEGGPCIVPYHMTVGHVVTRLLRDISAREVSDSDWSLKRHRFHPRQVREWLAAVKRVGEEKWLMGHVTPVVGTGPDRYIVRAVGAKYPDRLPAIYRAALKRPLSNGDYVPEILASKLTREQKVALFEEGAGHPDLGHRLLALEGLAGVDPISFRKHLLLTFERVRARAEAGERGQVDPDRLVPLVERADDPGCWDALAAAARGVPHGERLDLIGKVGRSRPDRPDPLRRERLRFLAQFLDDPSAERSEDEEYDRVAVRDYTASQLAGLLGFRVDRNELLWVRHDPDGGPVSRFVFRQVVRQAAGRELARSEK